jgi:hypothetical protein
MCKRLIVSLFVSLGFLVLAASAQPPVGPGGTKDKKTDTPTPPTATQGQPAKGGGGAGGTPKADPTDALVHAALANDPDVKLAQAKMQLAEAEMAKAKQSIILKVMTLNATIQDLKSQVAAHTLSVQVAEKAMQNGTGALADLLQERMKLEPVKSALAKAEMELKLITGGMNKEMGANTGSVWGNPNPFYSTAGQQFSYWSQGLGANPGLSPNQGAFELLNTVEYSVPLLPTAKGPIPDRIRASLDKTVKLGAKGEQVTFAKALEVFKKDAGLDVPVREVAKIEPIKSEGEELPVGAWFQLFADNTPGSRFLVREYGLLVTVNNVAPPGALQLFEFWKQPVKKDTGTAEKRDALLRKYPVPAGTAEVIAKTLQQHEPAIRFLALPETNEILVFATALEHAAVAKQIKEVGGEKTPEAKSKNPPELEKK